MWHHAGGGRGAKDMVILPYKDRLALFSKYLQQLVMESLGKELDLDGNKVNQGLAVYGNKGSTDQHAYVQQLRDGVNNFFATFIEVREAGATRSSKSIPASRPRIILQGFLRGTRTALFANGRESVTLSVPRVDAFYLGALIALFERAVGVLRQPGQRQCLPPAGRRGRQEGGGRFSRIVRQGARRSRSHRPDSGSDRGIARRRPRGRLALSEPSRRQ